MFRINNDKSAPKIKIFKKDNISKKILLIIIGLVGLILFSELIVRATLFLLKDYNISTFIVGLLIFSVGTNLPELIIAVRSFKRKVEELSFSNLIGSAMGNVLMIGILSSLKTIKIEVDYSYVFLLIFSFVFFTILYIFYKTDKLLSRSEGLVLLFLYLFFVSGQIFIQLW